MLFVRSLSLDAMFYHVYNQQTAPLDGFTIGQEYLLVFTHTGTVISISGFTATEQRSSQEPTYYWTSFAIGTADSTTVTIRTGERVFGIYAIPL